MPTRKQHAVKQLHDTTPRRLGQCPHEGCIVADPVVVIQAGLYPPECEGRCQPNEPPLQRGMRQWRAKVDGYGEGEGETK